MQNKRRQLVDAVRVENIKNQQTRYDGLNGPEGLRSLDHWIRSPALYPC